jgi:hypothetical protein
MVIYGPDRTQLPQSVDCSTGNPGGGCNLALPNLPLAGTYFLWLKNPGYPPVTGGALTLSSDKTGTMTAGTGYALSLRQGQNGRLTFTGTAASHSMAIGAPATVPSGQALTITVVDSTGKVVASGSYNAAGILALGTLTAGTYTVLVNPQYGAATVTLTYQ